MYLSVTHMCTYTHAHIQACTHKHAYTKHIHTHNSAPSSWLPPDLSKTTLFEGKVYNVILYQLPPFVEITNWDGSGENGDPGNVNGTRIPEDGSLSGLT